MYTNNDSAPTPISITAKTYNTQEEVRAELQTKMSSLGYSVTLNTNNPVQLVFKHPSQRIFLYDVASGSTLNPSIGLPSAGINYGTIYNQIKFNTGYPTTQLTFTFQPFLYASNTDLLAAINTALSGSNYKAGFQTGFNERIYFYSDTYFSMISQASGGNSNTGLGFSSSGVLGISPTFYRSYTFPPVDFQPPSTISDTDVFMRLVNAEVFGLNPGSVRIPYTVSILNLNQAVGTMTEQDKDCRPSTYLGTVSVRGISEKSPRILTHIPNGLQALVFRVDQLYQADRDFYISDNQAYTFTIEFEVSTHK